ncbi:MAG: ComEC/Rec2 family competence protein, partial [Pseudomonadota bacterium]
SRSSSNHPRLLLRAPVLYGLDDAPRYVRITLVEREGFGDLAPGDWVMARARIGPPGGPVEPGGFDFRRLAWFQQLGGVGYTDQPVLRFQPRTLGLPSIALNHLRHRLAGHIRRQVQGNAGAFAAAILTGDRSAVDPAVTEDLRATNLAHLLAISGLHMGLLTAFVFLVVRGGLALLPGVALHHPIKKWAACSALMASVGYLALSGASVATQRAFIMAAVALVAILLDRPALTLRSVAIAASIIIALRPESVIQAGFHLSFAATAALVAVFEVLRGFAWWRDEGRGWVSLLRPVLAVGITAFVAGLATAPFAAYHFNLATQYGLVANVLAVPLMGTVIMPAGVLALVLSPLGVSDLPFWIMGQGIALVLHIAKTIHGWEGATWGIVQAPGLVLPLSAFGLALLCLNRGRLRAFGVIPLFAGALIWSQADRPDLLVGPSGRIIGVMGPEGRALSRARGQRFVAESWLENDGDLAGQEEAGDRTGWLWEEKVRIADLPDGRRVFVSNARSRVPQPLQTCAPEDIAIMPNWSGPPEWDCITLPTGRGSGAITVQVTEEGLVLIRAEDTPLRLWSGGQ